MPLPCTVEPSSAHQASARRCLPTDPLTCGSLRGMSAHRQAHSSPSKLMVLQKRKGRPFCCSTVFAKTEKAFLCNPCCRTFLSTAFPTLRGVPGAGKWTVASSADRAAAESGVAGLGSEPMATLCVEWLEPLLERSDSDESCFAKPAVPRRPRRSWRCVREPLSAARRFRLVWPGPRFNTAVG